MLVEDMEDVDQEQVIATQQAEEEDDAAYEQLLQTGGVELWRRPDLPPIDPGKDSIGESNGFVPEVCADGMFGGWIHFLFEWCVRLTGHFTKKEFQVVEADYVTIQVNGGQQRTPVIRCYGVTERGNSVCAFVHGFEPYFYVPTWTGFSGVDDLRLFGDSLSTQLRDASREKLQRYVTNLEVVQRKSVWGYQEKKHHDFIKITVAVPSLVATARRLLENGLQLGAYGSRQFQTYESNVAYVLRWMVDLDVKGGGWLEIPAGKYKRRDRLNHVSYCQLEVDLKSEDLISHPSEGKWNKIAPMRILSFDIECAGRKVSGFEFLIAHFRSDGSYIFFFSFRPGSFSGSELGPRDPDCELCPGPGPVTTTRQERVHFEILLQHRRLSGHQQRVGGRFADAVAQVLPDSGSRHHHRLQHHQFRFAVSSGSRCGTEGGEVPVPRQDHRWADNHEGQDSPLLGFLLSLSLSPDSDCLGDSCRTKPFLRKRTEPGRTKT